MTRTSRYGRGSTSTSNKNKGRKRLKVTESRIVSPRECLEFPPDVNEVPLDSSSGHAIFEEPEEETYFDAEEEMYFDAEEESVPPSQPKRRKRNFNSVR